MSRVVISSRDNKRGACYPTSVSANLILNSRERFARTVFSERYFFKVCK